MTIDLDPDRFPHETRRALIAAGVDPAELEPGLYGRPEAGCVVIVDAHGVDLARIPTYRLAEADYDLVWPLVEQALEMAPTHTVDQVLAAIRDGKAAVLDNPAGEWLRVDVAGQAVAVIHRSHVVASWPDEHTRTW